MPVAGEPSVEDPSSDPNRRTRWSYTSSSDLPLPEEDPTQPFCPRHAMTIAHLSRASFGPYPIGVGSTTPHRDWHFGNLDYVLTHRRWCRVCGLIADVIEADPANTMLERNNAEIIACWVWDGVVDTRGSEMGTLRLRIAPEMVGWEDLFEPFDLVPLADIETDNNLFFGRQIGFDQFDLKQVKTWIKSCAEWHGSECIDTKSWKTSEFGASFIRMVSLADNRLIETSCPPSYVALSYVWGSAAVFQTIQSNVEDLMRPHGLPVSSFPKSICDAMTLARELGFQYIWIDSICIIQDSREDKIQQLRMMDSIYRRANLTIVAAAGPHANAGIPGLQPGSRSWKQHTVRISDDLTLVALHPDTHRSAAATTWNTRDLITDLPYFPSWSWAGWTGPVGYEDWNEFNHMPELKDRAKRVIPFAKLAKIGPSELEYFTSPTELEMSPIWSKISTPKDGICYILGTDNHIYHSAPFLEASPASPQLTSVSPPHWLSLRTRIAHFRLTSLVLSSDYNKDDSPIERRGRFGISLPLPANGDRPWLGTILLPVQYHAKMAQNHEFIILSESYGFSRQEMAPVAASKMKPFGVYDVMMIRRVNGDELEQYQIKLISQAMETSISHPTDQWVGGKSVVERIGVGRMIKSAWDFDDNWEDFVLV
ncbi:hypothetical protein TARUN_2487 [Trichoderma arundinaceum]|uniref:Heterokaryon incompatibility domain-containing protein n=1 Tax=Trichoderma arundinaceum TaxID=490622 RepID=A0A395NUS2_TRIAR|nr:hypothetical protein TARUN_2487 [Trichoderma arundinaceum]